MQKTLWGIRADKRGLKVEGDAYTVDEDRLAGLDEPALPEHKPGTYKQAADLCVKLNQTQIRSGFLDYLYSPEVVSTA